MPEYTFGCEECGNSVEIFDLMRDAVAIGKMRSDGERCPSCLSPRLVRILEAPPKVLGGRDEGGIYEQVWFDNGDGRTITVEPAARSLKNSHRKVLPKSVAMPNGPRTVPNPGGRR